ncbi:hypothetical protein PS918_03178 [Pseudomonas fluorescens]|uniref:Transmembrane protein n=1 Tax=Pseudomonas fluorescens TaxID=294 RepID=A0A5E7SX49_PSEFL|nr:hypothetical protein [Pseudomonas fluorescens]VVP90418.1 hypothetical protein PS918_03178 [Pseudomonas fluorescens]
MGWYSATNAWAAKVSKRITNRQRRIAAAVFLVCWWASDHFQWPVAPVFFYVLASNLFIFSLFIKEDKRETGSESRVKKAR